MRDEIESKMATDDERREVAERLREFTKDNQWPLTVGGNSSTIRYAISDIVFGDKKYHSGVDLLDRLADLIEPGDMSQGCRDTVACDREALLALARWLDARATDLLKTNSIDRSRRRLVRKEHAMDLMIVCGCIREACGEES